MRGDDAEQDLFSATADQDRGVRSLHGLRIAPRVADGVVAADQGGTLLRPQRLADAQRFLELRQTPPDRRKRITIRVVLDLVPAGSEAEDQPAAAELIDRRRHLGEQRWLAVRVAGNQRPEADSLRLPGERCEQAPALHLWLVRRSDHSVEVIVQPDRVVTEALRLLPVRDQRLVGSAFLGSLYAEANPGGVHGRSHSAGAGGHAIAA
jgi:hypothetical protein